MMIFSVLIVIPVLLYVLIPMPKAVRYVLAGLLVGGLYLLFWPSTYRSYRLEQEGRHTTGILLSKNCEVKKSPTVSYRFFVGGNQFLGSGTPGSGNQSCEHFQTGDQIFITYLESNPHINTPEREVDSDIFLGVFFAMGYSDGLFGGMAHKHALSRKSEERRRKMHDMKIDLDRLSKSMTLLR